LVASSAKADDASTNIEFQKAIYLIENGYPLDAAIILERLFQETGAPRIRLELARALMRSGQLDQARKLFVEAYEANPPIQVKATIARFIDQIDHIRGKFAFGISAAHLTNPLAQPSLFSFNWNGFALQSNVNPKQQNVWGAIYFGSYEKTF